MLSKIYKLPDDLCPCKFEVVGPSPFPKGKTPAIHLDYKKIDLNCKRTWQLIGEGDTKGIFQLERHAGKRWSEELKPENIEQMAALGALLRPGCTQAFDEDGISMTQHYCRRKNGQEEVKYFHPSLKPILEKTYGILVFQESAMKIAVALAGFNPQEADVLRKAIGEKRPEEMSKVKKWFIEKAETLQIVTKEEAEHIFSWIEKSQRYSFNKSHAVAYGIRGYYSAYVKAHFPLFFYCSWLRITQDRNESAEELVNDAKKHNIEVYLPCVKSLKTKFNTDGSIIQFGLTDVKDIGESSVGKFVKAIKEAEVNFKPLAEWSWYEFLIKVAYNVSKTTMENLIRVGGFRNFHENRATMLYEYSIVRHLRPKEIEWLNENLNSLLPCKNLVDGIKSIVDIRKQYKDSLLSLIHKLENPPISLEDNIHDLYLNEEKYLGVPITCNLSDIQPGTRWNITCLECLDKKLPTVAIVKVKVEEINSFIVKKKDSKNFDKEMANIKISDNTCELIVTCFSDCWQTYRDLLKENSIVEIKLTKFTNKKQLCILEVWPTTKQVKLNISDSKIQF